MTHLVGKVEEWEEVRKAIRIRMRELKMSTAHLARETGLSETTVRYIGQSLSGHNKSTLVAISAVLRWRYDYLTNILNGEPQKNVRINVATLNSEVAELRRAVSETDKKFDELLKENSYIAESIKDLHRFLRVNAITAAPKAESSV